MLPQLSAANVWELLGAALPWPQFSPEQAVALVIQHLVNRRRARKSRLKHRLQHVSCRNWRYPGHVRAGHRGLNNAVELSSDARTGR